MEYYIYCCCVCSSLPEEKWASLVCVIRKLDSAQAKLPTGEKKKQRICCSKINIVSPLYSEWPAGAAGTEAASALPNNIYAWIQTTLMLRKRSFCLKITTAESKHVYTGHQPSNVRVFLPTNQQKIKRSALNSAKLRSARTQKVWHDNDVFIAPNRLHGSSERLHSENIPVFPRKHTPERPRHARARTATKNMTSTLW